MAISSFKITLCPSVSHKGSFNSSDCKVVKCPSNGNLLVQSASNCHCEVLTDSCYKPQSGRKWQPTPGFLPGKSYGQRSLVNYSPWGCKSVRQNLYASYRAITQPTNTSASILHCFGSGNLTGSHLAWPINTAWRVDLPAFCFTLLGMGNIHQSDTMSIPIIQSSKKGKKRCNHFTWNLLKYISSPTNVYLNFINPYIHNCSLH